MNTLRDDVAAGEPRMTPASADGAAPIFTAQEISGFSWTSWKPLDYAAPPEEGYYWVLVSTPDYDADVDKDGRTVGTPTGEFTQSVAMVTLSVDPEGGISFDAVDSWNLGKVSEESWVTHYAAVGMPSFPGVPASNRQVPAYAAALPAAVAFLEAFQDESFLYERESVGHRCTPDEALAASIKTSRAAHEFQSALCTPAAIPTTGDAVDVDPELRRGVDHAHEVLGRLLYRRDGDFFVNANRVGAEALHLSTVATIAHAAQAVLLRGRVAVERAAPSAVEWPVLDQPHAAPAEPADGPATSSLFAFEVTEMNEGSSVVVFAPDGRVAHQIGAAKLEVDLTDIESCEPAPQFDCFAADGKVPPLRLLTAGWTFVCPWCNAKVADPDNASEQPQGRAAVDGDEIFCCTEHLMLNYAERQLWDAQDAAMIEAAVLTFPGITGVEPRRFGRPYPELGSVQTAIFDFPGRTGEKARWEIGSADVIVSAFDLPAWRAFEEGMA